MSTQMGTFLKIIWENKKFKDKPYNMQKDMMQITGIEF